MEDTPPVVEDLALGAFRLVKERLGFELDFSAETLPLLDHYLELLREEEGGEPGEPTVALVAPCAGAYFGEVLRRTLHDLVWRLPEASDEYRAWRVGDRAGLLELNPVGAALEALLQEAAPGWAAHLEVRAPAREAVRRSLEATGAVREGDFYRLAVRHEVIEQALAVVRS